MKKILVAASALGMALIGNSVMAAQVSQPVGNTNGLYISGYFGPAFMADATVTDGSDEGAELSYDSGFSLGATFGFELPQYPVRVEAEIGYQSNDYDQVYFRGISAELDGDQSSWNFLANALYDFNNATLWTPYIVGGIGFSKVEVETYGDSYDDTVFAWQIGGGVEFDVTPQVALNLQYRWFNTADADIDDTDLELSSHNVTFGVRYSF